MDKRITSIHQEIQYNPQQNNAQQNICHFRLMSTSVIVVYELLKQFGLTADYHGR